MSQDEQPPTEEELQEAEALRVALDGDESRVPGRPGAADVVSMLRATRHGAVLDDITHATVLKRVMEKVPAEGGPHRRSSRRSTRWLAFGAAIAAAAAVAVLRFQAPASVSVAAPAPSAGPLPASASAARRESPAPAVAPAPSSELLHALTSAHLGMADAEVAALGREANAYRRALMATASGGGEQ